MIFYAFFVFDSSVFRPQACKEDMLSACFFVASVSVVATVYVISELLCFLELLREQAYVFTPLSFGGGCARYGLISAQTTNLMVLKKMSVSARRFALPSAIMTP